jgi:hypothetical protein
MVLSMTDGSATIDTEAKARLRRIRGKLLLFWSLMCPASLVRSRVRKRRRTIQDYLFLMAGLMFYVFTMPMDVYLRRRASREWREQKTDRSGSEKCICSSAEESDLSDAAQEVRNVVKAGGY